MTLGRMALISVGAGLLLGGCTSVLPFELFMLSPVLFFLFVFWSMGKLRARHPGHLFLGPVMAVVHATVVVLVAQAAPLKFIDRETVQLDSPCSTVGEVATRARSTPHALPSSLAQTRVCFRSSTPTLREVIRECDTQAGVTVRFFYCGNGATVLWGASPMSLPMFLPRGAH